MKCPWNVPWNREHLRVAVVSLWPQGGPWVMSHPFRSHMFNTSRSSSLDLFAWELVLGMWNKVPQCGRVWHVWHICFPRSLSRLSPDFSTDEYRAWCIENRESQTVPTIRSLWYPYVYILPSNDWDRDPVVSYGDVNTSVEQIQPPGLWLAIRKKILARVHPTAVRKTRPIRLTLLALLAYFSGEHAGTCKNGSDTRFLNPIWDVMQWCIGLGGRY